MPLITEQNCVMSNIKLSILKGISGIDGFESVYIARSLVQKMEELESLPPPWTSGICGMSEMTQPELRLFNRVQLLWPEHSGSIGYPISISGAPYLEFSDAVDYSAGEYGAARLRLVRFIRETLDSLIYNK